MRTRIRCRPGQRRHSTGRRSRGAASVEFALLTTAVAAATVGIAAGLEAVAGGSFGDLLRQLAEAVAEHS